MITWVLVTAKYVSLQSGAFSKVAIRDQYCLKLHKFNCIHSKGSDTQTPVQLVIMVGNFHLSMGGFGTGGSGSVTDGDDTGW